MSCFVLDFHGGKPGKLAILAIVANMYSIWGQLIVASLIIGMVSYPSNDLTVCLTFMPSHFFKFGQFDSFRSLVSTGDLSNTLTPWETVLALFIVGVIKV